MRRRCALGAAVVLLFALAPAGSSRGATLCVGTVPGITCDQGFNGDATGLQAALDTAETNGDADAVAISTGQYQATSAAGFSYDDPEQLQIFGTGSGTVIRGAAVSNSIALSLDASGPGSVVRDLTVRRSGSTNPLGLRLEDARAVTISVDQQGATGVGTGVELLDGALLRNSSVFLPVTFGPGVEFAGDGVVEDSEITAPIGTQGTSGDTIVRRSSIVATAAGVSVGGNGTTGSVENSLIQAIGTNADGLYAFTGATLNAGNATIVGVNSAANGAFAVQSTAGTATLNLDSSTVTGFVSELTAGEGGGGNAQINVSYSNYDDVTESPPGQAVVNEGAGNVNVAPGFVGANNRRLLHSSPLIDVGHPSIPPAGTLDRDLLPRAVDGKFPFVGARRDMGAYEYQRRAPTASIAGPAGGQPGTPLAFTATGSDPDDGESGLLAFAWDFGDGATATGTDTSHAWQSAGSYLVTLTATDPTGRQGSIVKTVTITAAASGPTAEPGGSPGTGLAAADLVPPVIRRLSMLRRRFRVSRQRTPVIVSGRRKAKRGSAFRFRLSEAATVRIRLERRVRGQRLRGKCRRARAPVARRRCWRWQVAAKTLVRKDLAAGSRTVRFTGRVGRKPLPAGLYRASLRALDKAGNRSRIKRVSFRIVR